MEIKDTCWETELKIDDKVFKIIYGSGNQASNGLFINISFYHRKGDKKIDDRELFKLKNKVLCNIRENSYIYNRYFKSSLIDYRRFDDYNPNNKCEIAFQEFELTLFFKRYINIRHYIIEEIVKELVNESLPIIQETKILEIVNRSETKKSKKR